MSMAVVLSSFKPREIERLVRKVSVMPTLSTVRTAIDSRASTTYSSQRDPAPRTNENSSSSTVRPRLKLSISASLLDAAARSPARTAA